MNYFQPLDLNEALQFLSQTKLRIAAGCTDILPTTEKNELSGNILDISKINSLKGITTDNNYRKIGALTTWSEIFNHDLPDSYQMLKECSREIGSIQIQNSGTIGGNLCNASPAADSVPCLLNLDAHVELKSLGKKRVLPISKFIIGSRKTGLFDNEILTSILIPRKEEKGISDFVKIGARKYLIISIAMAACKLEILENKINSIAISIGSCSEVAKRIISLENILLGKSIDKFDITQSEFSSMKELSPINDIRSDKNYREHAAKVLILEVVTNCIRKYKRL